MPSLLELQQAVGRSLLLGTDTDASISVIGDGLNPADRLGIYRNTSVAVLVTALRLVFVAVQYVVGLEFFEGAARRFAAKSPPRSAWLDGYGADFPEFLARLPQAASLPYLPDLARLEWKVNLAMHAPDTEPMDVARLATLNEAELARLRLEPHPAVQLLQCASPVDALWHAVLERDDAAMTAIDLADGPVCLLVQRTDSGIDIVRLSEAEWQVAAALFSGQPLAQAMAAQPGLDAHTAFAAQLARGCFANFSLAQDAVVP